MRRVFKRIVKTICFLLMMLAVSMTASIISNVAIELFPIPTTVILIVILVYLAFSLTEE